MVVEPAELIAYDSTNHLATVRLEASLSSVLPAVPVSRAIPAVEMVAGRRVALTTFATSDPTDAMVVGVY